MYKLENVVADGGELIIYAPHIKEISVVHGEIIRKVGYHTRDYFLAQSRGRLRVEGRVFAPLAVPAQRSRYEERAMGAAAGSLYETAAHALLAREGAASMADFDGLAFLYEPPPETHTGRALWPHRSLVEFGRRRVPYYVHVIGEAGGDRSIDGPSR